MATDLVIGQTVEFAGRSALLALQNGTLGAAAARAYNQPFADAFSHWMTEVHKVAVHGDTVMLEMTVYATHTGPLVTPQGSFAATGRSGAVPCAMVVQTRDGRIVHEATCWNVPDLMAQLFPAA